MKNIYLLLCAGLLLCQAQNVSAQVPKLSSFPSAAAVLFLDFDGQTVVGTSWNSTGPIDCSSANLDSAQISEIFKRVSEDYRPFNINVTTDSTKYWLAPALQRQRVILTTTSSWFGNAGGVSYNNSFTWGDNTPCFVFTALLNYNVKFIAEAASHEAGHTLGLNHQSAYDSSCNKTSEYNAGTGSGEIGWAPIMGVGYYRNQTLWHYGSNPFGCSYMQDDLGVITGSANGFGYRADDMGNTAATAAVQTFTNNHFSVNGVIERPYDADVMKFTLKSKNRVQFNALPFSSGAGDDGANVDLKVELISSKLTDTATYNPATMLSASIDTILDAGTYYLSVQGTGNANAPNFASLGSYTLDASIMNTTLPVHKLELKAKAENSRHQLNWEIVADENVMQQTLEAASDGVSFGPVASVASDARSYAYQPVKAPVLYYRLNVLFDNGRQFYSNVAVLQNHATDVKPVVMGNLVTSRLTVNSPSAYEYLVTDMSGRALAKGQLVAGLNSLSTDHLPQGMYLLRIANNQEQYTEKFMK